jgi:hypothetical protein
MYIPLVDNRTNETFMAEIMEDESLEIKDEKTAYTYPQGSCIGLNDPCYAIFMFHHYEAPFPPNTDEAIRLLNWYNAICETDSFDLPSPGERMIGQIFNVECWKNIKFEDSEMAELGHVYKAVIEDYYGFGTDGFVIPELNMTIDTALLAINHFVIA